MTTIRYIGRDLDDPDGQTYVFRIAYNDPAPWDLINTIYAWNRKEFGESGRDKRWVGYNTFYFREAADAMHFRLRWC